MPFYFVFSYKWILGALILRQSNTSPVIFVLITYAFGHSFKVNAKLSSEAMYVYMYVLYERSTCGRAKNRQKVAYLWRNPSPSVKWKTIV